MLTYVYVFQVNNEPYYIYAPSLGDAEAEFQETFPNKTPVYLRREHV